MDSRIIFIIVILCSNYIFSQNFNFCGTDLMMKKNLEKHQVDYKLHRAQIDSLISSTAVGNNNDTKIIPLVFHIIHEGKPIGIEENISREQIEDAIRILNEDFNASNEDLDNVNSQFYDIVGTADIQFKLARLDPDGNCTDGITRHVSTLSAQADDCIKTIVAWDDSKYVNIWVVESIDSSIGSTGIVAGYANLPGSFWENEAEGIVVNNAYVGSIGTSSGSAFNRHVLTHEMGHFLNLNHPWGDYGVVGDVDNCSTDDGVTDTPNTIGSYSTCNISQETCGSLDNIQNFMDYSSCTCMFTSGQVNRMQSCLNSSISNRNNLWSNINLWDTGVHGEYNENPCLADVDFFISKAERICFSNTTTFINNSKSLGENPIFSWSFLGAEPEFSTEENPVVLFLEPGEYNVTLSIANEAGESSITKTYNVYESPVNLVEDFEDVNFPNNSVPNMSWSIVAPESETSWARTPISSSSTTGSVRIRSRFFDCYKKHYLFTPNLNLSNFGLGVGEPLRLWFDIAYGKRNNQTNDLLIISYSKDCGETWQVRATWDTDDLITTSEGTVGNNFIPNSNEWLEKSVNIQAAAEQSDVIIRFEFSGDRGSYLYIDNVRLIGEWLDLTENNNYLEDDNVIKRIDLLGRENNKSRFYIDIYNNGNVKKKYEIK